MTEIEPFVDGLRGFLRRRVPAQEVDDLSQEILLRLHRQSGTLRDPQRVESWVYGIARRAIADFYRGRHGSPPTELLPDDLPDPRSERAPAGFAPSGGEEVHEEVLSWLRPMAMTLPAKYREALLLADFERLPQRVVAERLGLSLSGAKSRVQRARAMLGERLHGCCEVELDARGRAIDYRPVEDCCDPE